MAFADEHNLKVKAVGEADFKIQKEFLYVIIVVLALVIQYVCVAFFVTMYTRTQVFGRKFMS